MNWSLGIAIFGALLGVINTWFIFRKSAVRVKVLPKFYLSGVNEVLTFTDIEETSLSGQAARPDGICIIVQNLSEFPLTVNEVGFLDKNSKDRFHLKDYFMGRGGQLPSRVESRSSIAIYSTGVFNEQNVHRRFKAAYVTTECGKRFIQSCKKLKLDQLGLL
jgi:hypothetical protein